MEHVPIYLRSSVPVRNCSAKSGCVANSNMFAAGHLDMPAHLKVVTHGFHGWRAVQLACLDLSLIGGWQVFLLAAHRPIW